MSKLIISVSGLRGIVGETLTIDVATRYAAAYSNSCKEDGLFVLTRDSRPSGEMLSSAVEAALLATGRDVFDAGIASTPTCGVLIRELGAAGGIQISASHNPIEYNGIKLFDKEGRVIPGVEGKKVLEAYNNATPTWVTHEEIGESYECTDALSDHLEAVLKLVDVEKIAKKNFSVLLDANAGAGALLGRPLLEALGCKTVILGEIADGAFLHPAEPTAANLEGVCSAITVTESVVGFCQDPDADRLAVIDEQERYIGEEYTAALCAEHLYARAQAAGEPPRDMVINCATSQMCEDIAAKYGATCHRSAVGEANVVDLMLAKDAFFAAEGNGGPIHPEVGLVRDSFLGMALILDYLATTDAPLSELVDALPRYAIVKMQAPIPESGLEAAFDKLTAMFPEAEASRLDGLRLTWDDRWLLLRGSNTEPIIRAIAEAPTEQEAAELAKKALGAG